MSQTTTGKTRLKTSAMIASIADEGQATILPRLAPHYQNWPLSARILSG
jgi:hypothetical protein